MVLDVQDKSHGDRYGTTMAVFVRLYENFWSLLHVVISVFN